MTDHQMKEDDYKIHARYYDGAYDSKADLVDLPFYVGEASKSDGPILEVGCGTGRITKAIADLGKEVVGVDASATMLEILKKSIEGKEVENLIQLIEGDLRTLQLGRKFPLIILPFRVLQHMYTLEDQKSAFERISAHLEPGGAVIFDVFHPRFESVYSGVGEAIEDLSWQDNNGNRVTRTFVKDRFDKVDQTFEGRFIYRTFKADACIKEDVTPLKMACYTVPHITLLLDGAGLEARKRFGGFDRAPLDNAAREIIVVAGKTEAAHLPQDPWQTT